MRGVVAFEVDKAPLAIETPPIELLETAGVKTPRLDSVTPPIVLPCATLGSTMRDATDIVFAIGDVAIVQFELFDEYPMVEFKPMVVVTHVLPFQATNPKFAIGYVTVVHVVPFDEYAATRAEPEVLPIPMNTAPFHATESI